MNADLEHLIVLQAQDLELKRLRAELAEAPIRVAAAQTARAKAEVALAEATQSLAKEETLRRSQELDVKDRQGKIARLQKQMETATSAAQITALEHEIDFARAGHRQAGRRRTSRWSAPTSFEAQKSAAAQLLETTDRCARRRPHPRRRSRRPPHRIHRCYRSRARRAATEDRRRHAQQL